VKIRAAKNITSIGDYLKVIRETSERWLEEDWKKIERDQELLLNDARIVGQIWFRGYQTCDLSCTEVAQ
jgi:hypothetical protein